MTVNYSILEAFT